MQSGLVKADQSFLERMHQDLSIEFESIMNAEFDSNKFYLFVESFKFIEDNEPIKGQFEMILLLPTGQINGEIFWFDKLIGNKIYPWDDVTNTDIEFHWGNLNYNPAVIMKLQQQKKMKNDVRSKLDLPIDFPVYSLSSNFSIDIDMHIATDPKNFEKVESTIFQGQTDWNNNFVKKLFNEFGLRNLGLVHSVNSPQKEKDQIIISIDTGSASSDFVKFILLALQKLDIQIHWIEIISQ